VAPHTVDDPVSADADSVDLVAAKDFQFTIGDGSGLYGYNVLKLGGDGNCTYTFFEFVPDPDPKSEALNKYQWRRADFVVDAKTMADLRQALVDADFFRLKKEYHAPNIEDGTQRWAKVQASGKRKAVYCNNVFPTQFENIRGFVNERIIGTHTAEINAAKIIQLDRKDANMSRSIEPCALEMNPVARASCPC
jgi:hypothetical protein